MIGDPMTVRYDSKERCLAVFRGEMPDRAPVCDFGNSAMLGYTGHTLAECRDDLDLVRRMMPEWVEATGADLFFGPIETKGIFMDLPGLRIKLPENDQGSLASPYYRTVDDVSAKPLYDPFDASASPKFHKHVVEPLKAISEACPDVMTPAWCEGVLTTSGFLCGVEDLLMMMLMQPDDAKRVIAAGADFSRDIVSAELEAFDADYVVYTDPVSSASMIDDGMFREFNLDLLSRNINHWKKEYGTPTMLHICGNTEPMLDDFVKTGAAAMSLDHAVDLALAKEKFSGRMAVMGNIDPVSVIRKGNADDVREHAQRCFDAAGEGGGFIFGAGCAVPNGTPIENIRAMSEVSKANPY